MLTINIKTWDETLKEKSKGGVMSFSEMSAFTGPLEELDRYIEWKAGSMEVLKHYKTDTIMKGAHMQRQFTIELRVDFADKDKLPELKQTLLQCARHALTTAQLLSDTPKTTQIAIYSNDFFSPPEEINVLEDLIQQGIEATNMQDEPQNGGIGEDLAAAVSG
jgi:hypothetical protein